VRTREKWSGRRCSPHEEEPGEFTSGGEAAVTKLLDGGELRRKQGCVILVRAVRTTKKKIRSRRNSMSNRRITREGKKGGRDPSPAMESIGGQQWLGDRETTAKARARVGNAEHARVWKEEGVQGLSRVFIGQGGEKGQRPCL
jgi:hypothetical protein